MSAQSALHARRIVRNVGTIVGVELLCGSQGAEFLESEISMGVGTRAAYEVVRATVPPLAEDRPLSDELAEAGRLV